MLNILLWFAVIVVISWVLILYVIPLILGFYFKGLSRKVYKYSYDMEKKSGEQNGKVKVDYMPEKNTGRADKIGEYVDFEEIQDK